MCHIFNLDTFLLFGTVRLELCLKKVPPLNIQIICDSDRVHKLQLPAMTSQHSHLSSVHITALKQGNYTYFHFMDDLMEATYSQSLSGKQKIGYSNKVVRLENKCLPEKRHDVCTNRITSNSEDFFY